MRSTRVSSANFTRIVAAQAMCGAARWQPANNCSDTYVHSVVFGPCRQDLTRVFGRHLSSARGLSPATLCNYLPFVRSFLIERFDGKPMQFDELRPVDIQGFVVRHAQTGSRRSAQ